MHATTASTTQSAQRQPLEGTPHSFMGIPLRNHTKASFVDWVIAQAQSQRNQPHSQRVATAYAINAHSVNLAMRHPDYLSALQHADQVYCDGISVLWAARILGIPLREKLTTTDVLEPICQRAAQQQLSMFLLGNAPGIGEAAAARLRTRFPGLRIVGTQHGFFTSTEEPEVLEQIRNVRPDILWVGMGNPHQELWVEKHRAELNVPVVLTCGAMMEIVAGHLSRPPRWITDFGGEWLYRLFSQPARTWRRYILGNPVFLARLLRCWIAQQLCRSRPC